MKDIEELLMLYPQYPAECYGDIFAAFSTSDTVELIKIAQVEAIKEVVKRYNDRITAILNHNTKGTVLQSVAEVGLELIKEIKS